MRKKDTDIIRYYPDFNVGLNEEEIVSRKKEHLVNKTKMVVGKSYFRIIVNNLFSFFNILLYIIAGLMIYGQYYDGLFFIGVLGLNTIIGLYQDIKARVLMGKLRLVTAPRVNVIRSGSTFEIPTEELVLDDITVLKSGSQIAADSIVLEGTLFVNESLLTGESVSVIKTPGDLIYSGSFVTSGSAKARVEKVGKDSYIESIQGQAKKFRRSHSKILKSLNRLFIGIGIVVTIMAACTIALASNRGVLSSPESFKSFIGPLSGSLVSMIPSGLYLLTSMALAVGVMALARKKAQVQDFYSIEMLSRTNILCVDKTGTITDGTMNVKEVIPFSNHDVNEIARIITNIIYSVSDSNNTSRALLAYFTSNKTNKASEVIEFNSENKYSAVRNKNGETFVMGAAEFLDLENKGGIIKRIEEYTSKGYRVLVAATNKSPFKDNKVTGKLTPVGMVVLQDHIKDDAYETFKWFYDNGVDVKVISGDNAMTVSEVARQAGIVGSERFISLEGKTLEEVYELADKFVVFGRVSPEQKEVIVKSLKDKKNTVAMTGDGVNDMLALKRADCSIAMASGSESAKNISHIVLLDSNFARLPDVVGEGRRVVNNLQRTCSLFLVKTIFAVVMSIAFLILSACTGKNYAYPFSTNNMYVWEIITIGLSAFFLALQKNNEKIENGRFLGNIFRKAVPAALTILIAMGLFYLGAYLQIKGICYTGITSYGFAETAKGSVSGATALCVLAFSALSLVILFTVCYPLDKYRGILFGVASFVVIGIFTFFGLIQKTDIPFKDLLRIDFLSLTGVNWMALGVVVVILAVIYFTIFYIYKVATKGVKQNENK